MEGNVRGDVGPAKLKYSNGAFEACEVYSELPAGVKRTLERLSDTLAELARAPAEYRASTHTVRVGDKDYEIEVTVPAEERRRKPADYISRALRHRRGASMGSADLEELASEMLVGGEGLGREWVVRREDARQASSTVEVASNTLLQAGNVSTALAFLSMRETTPLPLSWLSIATVVVGGLGAVTVSIRHAMGVRPSIKVCGLEIDRGLVSGAVIFLSFASAALNAAITVVNEQLQ